METPKKWAVGITTVPDRLEDLLPRTIDSIIGAGFRSPQIFVDGDPRSRKLPKGFKTVVRSQRVQAYCNFSLALHELFVSEPQADLYAMFQDDLMACHGLRFYLEACPYPENGYWNLFTFPINETLSSGWSPAKFRGKGAVALVFDRATARKLLTSPFWHNWPQRKDGWKSVDKAVTKALRRRQVTEYTHMPSLVYHVGDQSTVGSRRHAVARSFKGLHWDARILLNQQTTGAQ